MKMFNAFMYMILTWAYRHKKKIIISLLAIVVVVIGLAVVFGSCTGCSDSRSLEIAKEENDRVIRELEETRRISDELNSKIFELEQQIVEIRLEMEETAKERDRLHDEIDGAVTIDNINDLLRKSRVKRRK